MNNDVKVHEAITCGLAFLARQQRVDGGFSSVSGTNPQLSGRVKVYQTNFVPALILGCLARNETTQSKKIRDLLARFLLRQRSPNWAFNYWSRAARQRTTHPYPDDLDDTFCALSALYLHDPHVIDERTLVSVVKMLVATETHVGGPYRTWLVPGSSDPAWLDIDVAANSNVAYFLSLASRPLPRLTRLMVNAVHKQKLSSPYYPSTYPLAYFVARALPVSQSAQLVALLRSMLSRASSALDMALSLSSLLRLGRVQDSTQYVQALLDAQSPDGSWPAAAFCIDPEANGERHYNGCTALTTAFVIEALQLASQKNERQIAPITHEPLLAQNVRIVAQSQARNLPRDLAGPMWAELRVTCSGRSGVEIMTIAEQFNRSLQVPLKRKSTKFFLDLGLANVYGWLAYTIYDDFLDDEAKPELLGVANVAHRQSLLAFRQALPRNKPFQNLVQDIFNTIDNANTWEVTHCRFMVHGKHIFITELPNYGSLQKLAERSLGHALAPLAVLLASDTKPIESQVRATRRALTHYLIARQLNDDLHDWQDDFVKGHVSYVVRTLLDDCAIAPGKYAAETLLLPMRQMFWNESLPRLCGVVRRHIRLSRQAFRKTRLLKTNNYLSALLDRLEESTQKTMLEQRQTRAFMQHYRKTKP